MDAGEARTIGRRVRQIRYARDKSLEVVAGLAGISAGHLSRIERGERALDRHSLIVALADALEVSSSELTRLPIPAPANGHTDSAIEAIRLALDAIESGHPDRLVLPLAVLRDQTTRIHAQLRATRFAEVASDLPGLMRNLHTALATGTDHGELLDLAVYLHVHVTRVWLVHAAAPTDLVRRVAFLAQRLAQEREGIAPLAMAGFGVADTLLSGGAFQSARANLDSITLPPTTTQTAGFVGQVIASHALAAAMSRRLGDVAAPMDAAVEVAERFGVVAGDSLGFSFGPPTAATYRIALALEADEPDQAVSIAQNAHPEHNPSRVGQSLYWLHYGCALAQLRGRRDDAVRALRTAEEIFPTKVRHPIMREVIATLLLGARRDAMGMELRRMAERAGLPV